MNFELLIFERKTCLINEQPALHVTVEETIRHAALSNGLENPAFRLHRKRQWVREKSNIQRGRHFHPTPRLKGNRETRRKENQESDEM
jgi:hypothetical protein